ncbi:MAG: Uma2 family endonuclease [Pseudomonadota bacterium]
MGHAAATPDARQPATQADLARLPEHLVGEIIDGELHSQPRPSGPHGVTEAELMTDLGSAFGRGRGGPGGWWILIEPQLHLEPHILVPDLAGWKRERMPRVPDDHRFTVVPDWVCEILSPSTARKDRIQKMRIYAESGVAHCWLLDPLARTLETYELQAGKWLLLASHGGDTRFRAPPFDAVEFELGAWWLPEDDPPQDTAGDPAGG